jgi:hypothetical protein
MSYFAYLVLRAMPFTSPSRDDAVFMANRGVYDCGEYISVFLILKRPRP